MNTKSPTRRRMIAETASSSGSGSNGSDTADCSSSTSKSPNNVIEFDQMIQVVGDVGYMKQPQEQQQEERNEATNKEIVETTVALKTILSENGTSSTFDDKEKDVELILDLDIPSMDDAIGSSIHDKPKRFQLLPINKNKEQQQWTKGSTSILQLPHISPSSSSSVVSSSSKSSTFKQMLKSSLNVVSKQITMKTKRRLSASLGVCDNEEEENGEEGNEKEGATPTRTNANTKDNITAITRNEENVDISYMIQHEQWDQVLSYVSTSQGMENMKCELYSSRTDNSIEQMDGNNGNCFNLLQLALMYNPPMEFIQLLKDVEPNFIIQTRNNNNTNKQTPLHIACSWGVSSDIIHFLIDWSLSLSSSTSQMPLLLQKDSNGNIPLHLLCGVSWPHLQHQQEQQLDIEPTTTTTTGVQNFNSCIKLLIKSCPQSVSILNSDGIMPLQYLPPLVASEWICYSLKEQVFVAKKAMFVKQVML